jgi:hypothetical protein
MKLPADKLNSAIEAGLRSCDLYDVAQADILCRSHLRKFLQAALNELEKKDIKCR